MHFLNCPSNKRIYTDLQLNEANEANEKESKARTKNTKNDKAMVGRYKNTFCFGNIFQKCLVAAVVAAAACILYHSNNIVMVSVVIRCRMVCHRR